MGVLSNRVEVIKTYLVERNRFGLGPATPDRVEQAIFVLDGVGGFQFAPLLVRRTLRRLGAPIKVIPFPWQFGLVGEIWTDLMWHRRNRVQGARLARQMMAFRRQFPDVPIHVLAYSGGVGITVFACESLKGRPLIDTAIFACPAISPTYDLSRALQSVNRAYALTSPRDMFLLGAGTTLFGTTDRVFGPAAGMSRFRIPRALDPDAKSRYDRLREIHWSPALKAFKHSGGHTGWLMPSLLEHHLVPLLQGQPLLPTEPVAPE